ncbi:MAG TPA: hypothetical protein VNY05_37590 [Candidatus Acidoferrales bacterium]|jgi:hypothetical protein|nr:hypothetical protein [Candidatus Acidoferrales bacterium]
MTYIRRKTVTVDGVSILIGALSIDQVDHINDPLTEDEQARAEKLKHPTLATVYRFLSTSLNNVVDGAGWTPERIESEMDYGFVQQLQTAVMEFAGLRTVATADTTTPQ